MGQAGIVQTVVIVVIGGSVSLITSLSLSAISTNGEVSGGGAYYMVRKFDRCIVFVVVFFEGGGVGLLL